ncbi:MAG: SCO6745 family protein [Sciscionella sp.]
MVALPYRAGRHCQNSLNALHSTIYFSPDLEKDLAEHGIGDQMLVYLLGRAAPLGAAGAGVVTATFNGFKHDLIAKHIPHVWGVVAPRTVLDMRLRAADSTLRRFLGEEIVGSPDMAEAAGLALRASEACSRAARPLYAANADLPVPRTPHLALWHAATLLREHRGDSHFAALANADLDGLEALVSHSASSDGLPRDMVMSKRGWTQEDWTAAEQRLRRRGLMDSAGELTTEGVQLRGRLEDETDRLDRAPYEHLGTVGVERLTVLCTRFTAVAADGGAFPPGLSEFFTRP